MQAPLIRQRAFSLIELLISVAILSLLARIGLLSLEDYQIHQNSELAMHILTSDVALMEGYYARNGSYLISSGSSYQWPTIIQSVVGITSPVYSISFYPSTATSANQQAYCLVATPNSGTIQAGQSSLYIDRFAQISTTPPTNCLASNSVTTNYCASGGGSYNPCSGSCTGGVWSACSGNCNSVTVCAGGSGCSGNCRNSTIYGGCSGNCPNSVVYGGCSGKCSNSIIYGKCSGSCPKSICCDSNTGRCSSC